MTTNQWEEQAFEQSRIIEPKDQPPKKVVRSLVLRQDSPSGVVKYYCLIPSHASTNLTFDLPKTSLGPGTHLALSRTSVHILPSHLSKKKEEHHHQVIRKFPPPQPRDHQHLWRTPLELGLSPLQTFTILLLFLADPSTEIPLPCCPMLKRTRIPLSRPHPAPPSLPSHLGMSHLVLHVQTVPHPQFLRELSLQLLPFPPGRDSSNVCPPECECSCSIVLLHQFRVWRLQLSWFHPISDIHTFNKWQWIQKHTHYTKDRWSLR